MKNKGFLVWDLEANNSVSPVAIVPATSPEEVANILGGEYVEREMKLARTKNVDTVFFGRHLFTIETAPNIREYRKGEFSLSIDVEKKEFYKTLLIREILLVRKS